jgi:hypothetical protein
MLGTIALVALCGVGPHAQGAAAGQKPPDTKAKPEAQAPAKDTQARPAEAKAPELTAEQKAFNAIAEEKDAQKRVGLYEKFVADNPKAEMLVSLARSEIQRSTLATLKSSSARYLDIVKKEIDSAKSGANPTQLSSTYSRFAGELLGAGVLLDEAEDYARQSVSLLDEQKYIDYQKQTDQQLAEAFAKRAANPTPAPSPAPPSGGMSIRTVNGAPTVQPMPPRPPAATPTQPPRPATPPLARTDQALRAAFKSTRASNLATLGRVLMKRNKTAEGEKVLKEAYAAKPPAATVATIARLLAESAKKAGDDAGQMEYLTALALSGRITADEQKDFDAVYRKSHNGSLDGLEAMLDARYAKENPKFAVTPANRKPAPNQRAVLAENFTGSG